MSIPIKGASALEVAHQELKKGAGAQFDPVCVAAFMRLDEAAVERLVQKQSGARTLDFGVGEPAAVVAAGK